VEPRQVIRDWAPFVLLTLGAFLIRLPFADIPPYGDEGAFYYTSRHLDDFPPNVHDLYVEPGSELTPNVLYRPTPLFWYRPLHYLLMFPAAQAGFQSYRLFSLALTSTIPALAAAVLRVHGARRVTAWTAGGAIGILPYFVVWSVITLPDALVTMWFLLALLCYKTNRVWAMGAALLAAAWTKETVLLGIAALLALSLWTRYRSGARFGWPLVISKREAILAATIPLGLVPLNIALWKGGAPPGGSGAPGWGWLLEGLFGIVWFAPLVLLGFAYGRSRALAALALVYPAFYVLYGQGLDKTVNVWYLYLPASLAVIAAAMALDSWATAVHGTGPRRAPSIVAAAFVALILVAALVPTGGAKSVFFQPLTGRASDSVADALRYESSRDADLRDAIDATRLGPERTVFVIDVYGSYVLHPISTSGSTVWWGETRTVALLGQDIATWPVAIEERADRTLLWKQPHALNQAVRDVYADCIVLENAQYAVFEGSSCAGRSEALRERYDDLSLRR
jgi:hypothetical protein